jgi:hypothetical protein
VRPFFLFAFLLFALVLLARSAPADEGDLALRYEAAAEGCPSRGEFAALVLARTPHVRLTDDAARRWSVVLERRKGVFRGAFAVDGPGGRATREIEASTCTQLADAMSLVVALAVDPEAVLTPGLPPTAPQASDPEAPRGPAPPAPVADPVAALAVSSSELSPEPSTAAAPAPALLAHEAPSANGPVSPRTTATPSPRRIAVGIAVELETDVAPEPVTGVALRAEYEMASSSWLAPSFGAELAGAASNVIEGAPEVAVWFATLRLDVCPARAALGRTGVTVRACGAAAFGVVAARGVGAPNPDTAVRGWVDADLGLRARWEASRWFLGIEGGPVVPVTVPKFVFEQPYRFVYEAQVGVRTALFAGVRF